MINFQNILVKVRTLGIKSIILNDPTTYNSLSIKTLKKAYENAKSKHEKEHVTPYILKSNSLWTKKCKQNIRRLTKLTCMNFILKLSLQKKALRSPYEGL